MSKMQFNFHQALRQMQQWFQRQKRSLPWRDEPSFYRVWVSEIMLQQTQVITVVPYFERFVKKFPTVGDLAKSSLEDVLQLWAGLGYYSRARNLHRAAKMIVEKGDFPKTREGWLEIPGVGEYTAGAILSIADDQAEAILDGNVERVLSRVHCVTRQKGDAEYKSRLWKLSRLWVTSAADQKILPSTTNQALMELGATVCSPKSPRCLLCPLQKICRAFKTQSQESFPPKKKPKEWIQVKETLHCVLNPSGEVLLRKRESGEWRAGLWDLLEQNLTQVDFVGEVETRHVVTRHKIQRTTKIWKWTGGAFKAAAPRLNERGESEQLRWVSLHAPEVAVGSALKRTLEAVRSVLGSA